MGKVFFSGKYQLTKKGILRYYFNRFIRIIPLYIFVLIVSLIIYRDVLNQNGTILFRFLTFTANDFLSVYGFNGNLWTVSLLVQFYVLVPLIYFVLKKVHGWGIPHIFITTFIILFGMGTRMYYLSHYAFNNISNYVRYIYTPLITNLDIFLFCFYINVIIKDMREKSSGKIHLLFQKKIAVALMLLLFFLVNFYSMNIGENYARDGVIFILLPTATYIIFSYLTISFEKESYVGRISMYAVPLSFLNFVSKLSYGAYLWHWPVIDLFHLRNTHGTQLSPFLLKFIATFILTLGISFLTYKFIESKFARFKIKS